MDAVLNNSNESSDDINETYAGRDLTGSDGDVEECDEELSHLVSMNFYLILPCYVKCVLVPS